MSILSLSVVLCVSVVRKPMSQPQRHKKHNAGKSHPKQKKQDLWAIALKDQSIFLSPIINYLAQFSKRKLGIRENSLTLFVTKIRSRLIAWAAISISIAPITKPFRSSSALTTP